MLSTVDEIALASLRHDLTRIDDLWNRLDTLIVVPAPAGSRARTDIDDPLSAHAHDHAVISVRAALDHLRTWRNLITAGEIPSYAHMSLLRTAHETALLAYWTVEPGIDDRTRKARGVAVHAADLDERRKFESAMGRTVAAPAKLAAERLTDLLGAAAADGLTRQAKDGRTIPAIPVPSAVELFDRYEPLPSPATGQSLYRLYSGYAHGKQWALTAGAQPQTPMQQGRALAIAGSDERLAASLTRRTTDAVERVLAALEGLRRDDVTDDPPRP